LADLAAEIFEKKSVVPEAFFFSAALRISSKPVLRLTPVTGFPSTSS
jgi:hypothetical protein